VGPPNDTRRYLNASFIEAQIKPGVQPSLSAVSKTTSETPGGRVEPAPFAKVGLSQKFVSEITFSNLRFLYL
jgi:hypothetical protein